MMARDDVLLFRRYLHDGTLFQTLWIGGRTALVVGTILTTIIVSWALWISNLDTNCSQHRCITSAQHPIQISLPNSNHDCVCHFGTTSFGRFGRTSSFFVTARGISVFNRDRWWIIAKIVSCYIMMSYHHLGCTHPKTSTLTFLAKSQEKSF